jgi:hypothetical protein
MMPCNTVQTTTVGLEKADLDILVKAFGSLGFEPVRDRGVLHLYRAGRYIGTFERGVMTSPEVLSDWTAGQIKQLKKAYAGEVIKATASRFGWTMTVPQTVGKFTLTRRA